MERRLIDANELFDFLTDQLDKETGFYSKGRNAGLNVARSALLDETITPTIAPPPNDPLTIEELREMEQREWVWIKFLVPHYGVKSGYYITHEENPNRNYFQCGYPRWRRQ